MNYPLPTGFIWSEIHGYGICGGRIRLIAILSIYGILSHHGSTNAKYPFTYGEQTVSPRAYRAASFDMQGLRFITCKASCMPKLRAVPESCRYRCCPYV